MAGISRTFRTRLSTTVDQQLVAFCATMNMSTSAAIRWAVSYFLAHQAQAMEEQADGPLIDPRTPQQIAAWAVLEEELAGFDMEALVEQMRSPGA
jgi:hypothetical protein